MAVLMVQHRHQNELGNGDLVLIDVADRNSGRDCTEVDLVMACAGKLDQLQAGPRRQSPMEAVGQDHVCLCHGRFGPGDGRIIAKQSDFRVTRQQRAEGRRQIPHRRPVAQNAKPCRRRPFR